MHRFSVFWHMRLQHRLQGQKSKSRGGGILWRPPSRTACLHCATDKYICMTIEELTAKIRQCERKKMQFILIGKLDNISIKLVA